VITKIHLTAPGHAIEFFKILSIPSKQMRTQVLILLLSLTLLFPVSASERCTGSANCAACTSCAICTHCAKRGGTCSVCRPLVSAPETPASSSRSPQKPDPDPVWLYVAGICGFLAAINWAIGSRSRGGRR
jgi:hypothetical protein